MSNDGGGGEEAEDKVEKYLIDHNIPYRRNITFANRKTNQDILEFDFIIPNGIIETKKRTQFHEADDKLLLEQLKRHSKFLESILPQAEIYLLILGCEITPFEMLFRETKIQNLKLITSMDQINFISLPFYIDDNSILFSLISNENKIFEDRFINALIKEDLYYYSKAILTEEELSKMEQYSFIPIAEDPGNVITVKYNIGQKETFYRETDILRLLGVSIKKYVLSDKIRQMQRYIRGYSIICEKCNKIFSVKRIKKHNKFCR